jgi:hypothetical protein
MEQFYKKSKRTLTISTFIALFALIGIHTTFAQNHFTTIWQGENGQNHMNFIVVSALVEGLPMGINDEIAVFSGTSCVGTSKLTQTLTAGTSSTYVFLKASADDGSGNGFIANDTIVFKLWDSKTQKEMLAKAVKYRNDISSWLTTGHFSPGATSVVEIVSYTEYSQTIQLIKGTNLLSTYIIPASTNMVSVMKPLIDKGVLVSVTNELSKTLTYSTTTKTWVNNIGNLDQTEGYSINVSADCSLLISGKMVALPLSIPLIKGWNIISYPKTEIVNALSVVQPLIDQRKLLKVQDEKGNTIEKLKGSTGWKNSIGNFIPGKAYKISLSGAATLVIQPSYTKSALIQAQAEETEFFNPDYTGNGANHMSINLTGLSASGYAVGDELAAYDGNLCVGTLKLTEQNFLKDQACLVVSSGANDSNGFTSGNEIQLYGWNAETRTKSIVLAQTIDGEANYEEMSSVLLKMGSNLTTSATTLENAIKMSVYPNPARTNITVYFSQMPENSGLIEITDISGRKIVSRSIHQIAEEFNISSQPAGLYLIKSTLGNESIVQKLIINR